MSSADALSQHIKSVTSKSYIKDHYKDFDDYDRTVEGEYGYKAHIKIPGTILRLCCEMGKEGLRVLDIGCGTGLSSTLFFERGDCQCIGMDVSAEMLQQAAENEACSFDQLVCHSVEEPWPRDPIADDHFDAVVMLGVMEFVRDPLFVFQQAFAKLKPDGLFGIVIPLPLPLSQQQAMGIRTHEPKDVLELMTRAGFSLVHEQQFIGYQWEEITVQYEGTVWQKSDGQYETKVR